MKKFCILMLVFILSLAGCNMGNNDVAEPTESVMETSEAMVTPSVIDDVYSTVTPTSPPSPTLEPTPTPTLSPFEFYLSPEFPKHQWRVFCDFTTFSVGSEEFFTNLYKHHAVALPGDLKYRFEIKNIALRYDDKVVDITDKIWSDPDCQVQPNLGYGSYDTVPKSNIIQIHKADGIEYVEITLITPLYEVNLEANDLNGFAKVNFNYLTGTPVEQELSIKYLFKGEVDSNPYQLYDIYGPTIKIVYKIPVRDIFDLMEKTGTDKFAGIDLYKYIRRVVDDSDGDAKQRGEFIGVCSLLYLQFLD